MQLCGAQGQTTWQALQAEDPEASGSGGRVGVGHEGCPSADGNRGKSTVGCEEDGGVLGYSGASEPEL